MTSAGLRSKLIRLAHKNPTLRADLLPLLSKKAHAEDGDPTEEQIELFKSTVKEMDSDLLTNLISLIQNELISREGP